jgi:zinc protease
VAFRREGRLLYEADDQALVLHRAHGANGAPTSPGELVSFFESTGSRLGPHVNAHTSFDETVYMLDLPTESKDVVRRGVEAMVDFAGG